MKEELWMRTWNDGHPRFSDDFHRGLLWLCLPFLRIRSRIMQRATRTEPTPLPLPQRDAT
jgi:hypothetical protein